MAKTKKARMGRPALKPKDRRTALITIRLKPSERKQLECEARAEGVTISTYLLQLWRKSKG